MNLFKQTLKVSITASVLLGAMSALVVALDADDQPLTPQDKPRISFDQALQAVLSANPGTTAFAVELEKEKGALTYEVELDKGLEVLVDANTGKIAGTEQAEQASP